MLRLPAIFLENETSISSDNIFNIKFDSIKSIELNVNFYDLILYQSLNGFISNINCGLKILYYDEFDMKLNNYSISNFKKIIHDNKISILNINNINIITSDKLKYITRIEIIFTHNNIDYILFNSTIPQLSKFSERILNSKIKYGIALPELCSFNLINTFNILYK
jgi:hypothetical protein